MVKACANEAQGRETAASSPHRKRDTLRMRWWPHLGALPQARPYPIPALTLTTNPSACTLCTSPWPATVTNLVVGRVYKSRLCVPPSYLPLPGPQVVSYAEAQPEPRATPGTVMRAEVVTYPSGLQRLLGVTVAVAGLAKEQLGSAVTDAAGRCLGLVFARTAGSGKRKKGGGGGAGGGGGERGGGGGRWGHGRRHVGRRRSRRGQVEASATVVPVPVVEHFLEDCRRHGRWVLSERELLLSSKGDIVVRRTE